MAGYEDFWNKAGPGLLDAGIGFWGKNAAQQEASDKLGRAQGPAYQQAMDASTGMLTAAGNFDPKAFGQQRFEEQQALMAGVNDKEFNDLYRTLYAKGQLGIANYNPGIEGFTPNGTAMNPQLAAFFAAKQAQRSKDAYGAMDQGQKYLDTMLNRSGMLQRQAAGLQSSGLEAQRTQPSRAAGNMEVMRGLTNVLKDSGVTRDIVRGAAGGIKDGANWLGQQLGITSKPGPAPAPAPTAMGGGYNLGGGLGVDQHGSVTGGSEYRPNPTAPSGGGGYNLGGGLSVDEYGNVFADAAAPGMFNLGGGLAVDEYGQVTGGIGGFDVPDAVNAGPVGDLFDLGGGMGVDAYGNVMGGIPDAFDPMAFMDFSDFDLSGFGDVFGGLDFGWV